MGKWAESAKGPRATSVKEAFERRVVKGPGCWIWQGPTNDSGYGQFRNVNAHRWAYRLYVGPIAKGLHIDHTCRNKLCVRPDHLEPVTPTENNKRTKGFPYGPHKP